MSRYWFSEMEAKHEEKSQRRRIEMANDGCDIRSAGQRLYDALYPPGTPKPMRERRVIEPNE